MAATSPISDGVREQLRDEFAGLTHPVQLEVVIRGGTPDEILRGNQEVVRALADAMSSAAPERIQLTVTDLDNGASAAAASDVPTLLISEPGHEPRVVYRGVPAGYELSAVVDAVRRAGTRTHGISDANRAHLSALPSGTELLVFVTPTCPYCPAAAAMAFRLAMASPGVSAVTVEALEFPELADAHGVSGVPHTVVNGAGSFVGALPEDAFVAKVMLLAQRHPAQAA